ncbi:hypothetical protein Ct9H90mP29_12400 [bacterium]|nr:MAG: hypothetical protein Ct9H90mP29_12400 [bacterium]
MSLDPASDIVTIPPGSLYVDFKLTFPKRQALIVLM